MPRDVHRDRVLVEIYREARPNPRFLKARSLNALLGILFGLAGLCSLSSAIATTLAADPTTAQRPNIIFILVDDQGYGDLACHGNPIIKTPHLDRLHAESARFVDFHVSPTCSPTRSALMTGRHEFKNGVTHTIFERERLTPQASTVVEALQQAGYTTGIFGKWHLGDEDAYQPGRRGFDEVFIHGGGGIGQTFRGSCGDAPGNKYFDPVIRHNGRFEKTEGYCTDVFFRQAQHWIDQQAGKKPFYCYIAPNAPHDPLDCPVEYEARYRGQVPDNVAKFYGMITNLDDNLGRLLAYLRERDLERSTLVVFMTDNGSATGSAIFNAGMRGPKVSCHNGGSRVPSFWRWPGTIAPGDRRQLAAHLDFLPTLLEITGTPWTEKLRHQVEGRSLWPALRDAQAPWEERFLFTHVGRWPRGEAAKWKYRNCAVRYQDFLLVCDDPKGEKHWQLYNLADDPGEKHDLAAQEPAIVEKLDQAYDAWWQEVQPCLVNEDLDGPAENPFHTAYYEQFGRPRKDGDK